MSISKIEKIEISDFARRNRKRSENIQLDQNIMFADKINELITAVNKLNSNYENNRINK